MCICIYVNMYICIFIYVNMYIYVCMYMYAYMHIYIHMHICIHIHTYKRIYTYIPHAGVMGRHSGAPGFSRHQLTSMVKRTADSMRVPAKRSRSSSQGSTPCASCPSKSAYLCSCLYIYIYTYIYIYMLPVKECIPVYACVCGYYYMHGCVWRHASIHRGTRVACVYMRHSSKMCIPVYVCVDMHGCALTHCMR